MLIALWLSLAEAACPWAGAERIDVRANMTSVRVNGARYDARGGAFLGTLTACDAGEAIDEFNAWRRSRRATNTWAAIGLFTAGWGWFPIVVTAPNAGRHREAFVAQLANIDVPTR